LPAAESERGILLTLDTLLAVPCGLSVSHQGEISEHEGHPPLFIS
jgi:hypothetical protein